MFDEPLSNLDAKLRVDMRVEIRQLQRANGTTSVYVTHDQEEAFSISDRVAIMNAGRLMQFDRPEVLYRRPANTFVARFVGFENIIPFKVVARDGDMVTAETAGMRLRLSQAAFGAIPDTFLLATRPDGLVVSTDPAAEGLPAQLGLRTYLGRAYQYQCETPAGHVVANGSLTNPLEAGTSVKLVPVPEQCTHPCGRGSPLMASILITNACLLPIDEAMSVIEGGWIHIEGGTIRALGAGEPPQVDGAEIIDAGGDVVMPGMVNPHAHLAMTLFRGLGEDVDDRLFRYVLPMERKFVTPEMVRVGTLLGALESIEAGVTTIADMYYYETRGRAGPRSGGPARRRRPDARDLRSARSQDDRRGLSRWSRNSSSEFSGHERIVPSIAPHAPYSTDIEVMARVARWAEAHPGVPVQIHLAEMDSEMEWCRKNHGLRPVAVVEKAGLLIPGLIAAHCLHIDPFEIERMAKADVRVAHNARSNAKAGRGIAPIEAMRAAGIKVGIATDGPMSGNTLDLFSQFGPVSMFQKLLGHSRKPMPAAQVIRMATLEGAQVLGLDSRIGSLEPGKQADLIRIDLSAPRMQPVYDIYATLVFSAMPVDVQDVMVGGRWIMRGRNVESLERKKILRDAGQIATRSRPRWPGSTRRRDFYQTTGCVCPVATLTKPCGAASQGATRTQRQGAQVSVANCSRSGKARIPARREGRLVEPFDRFAPPRRAAASRHRALRPDAGVISPPIS